ncbi:MAG: Mut7-C RNAse domain-containing protein [Nitrospinae bacterium]|nr:Mut7-C RNAse domain-containing protein [Nitrospinota bacterium]
MKFIVDDMLGKLAKWMRIIGCDTEYFPFIDDVALLEKARLEGRTIITRDTLLVKRRCARGNFFLVKSNALRGQLRAVVDRFRIDPYPLLFTRCVLCNSMLSEVDKKDVAGAVPEYVYKTQETFRSCGICGKIFWPATHKEKIAARLKEILGI